MKRLFIISFFAILTILIAPKISIIFAQESVIQTETPIGVDMGASGGAVLGPKRINYELPYPGMLPDNPFYFLKVIRDGVVKILINKDITLARFSLENASKRMFAGKLLVEKGKDELAIETIAKGNNYLDDALEVSKKIIKEDPENPDLQPFLLEFKSAALKHQEISHDLKSLIDAKFEKLLETQEKRMKKAETNVEQLLLNT